MSDRCIYCDPDFGKDLKDDVEDQELGSDEVDIGMWDDV